MKHQAPDPQYWINAVALLGFLCGAMFGYFIATMNHFVFGG